MPKYVDADWIMRELGIGGKEERAKNIGEIVTAEDVDNWPAADVEPVRHGRWMTDKLQKFIWCSACKNVGSSDRVATNYCPNCGAKMDKETTGDV